MPPEPQSPRPDRFTCPQSLRIMAIAVLAMLGAALAWACLTRGPWYDEFYTQYVSRADLPWGRALRESWLVDNHPPLYYALARATAGLGSIAHHRLLNLAFGTAAVAGCVAVARDVPRLASAGAALALAVAANHWTLFAGSELRSYFLSLCVGVVLALSLCAIRLTGAAGGAGRRATYWIAALAGFNVHIVTSVTCAVLVAPFLLAAIVRRDWREARAIGFAPLVSGAILVAVACVQLPMWLANTQAFWIEPGFGPARWSIQFAVQRTLEANPLLLVGALAGGLLLARDVVLRRKASGEAGALALLAGGVALVIAVLVALHLWRPMLIEKYLMALVAAVMVGLALAFARLLEVLTPRLRIAAFGVTALVSIVALGQNAQLADMRKSWFGTGRAIAAIAAQCPGTVVHGGAMWNDDVTPLLPPDNARVVPFAYRYVADALGFRLAPDSSRELSRTCPTVFWGEHDTRRRIDAHVVDARLRAAGYPPMALRFERIGDGWIAIAPPRP